MTAEQLPASPRPARITIADVARAAGVSPSAVSFALNDRPGVSADTRQRILAVADELGWRPSARARALARSRANAVGLVLNRPVELLAADPFFSQFLAGLEVVLSPADHALMLQVIADDTAAEAQAYRRMADAGRVDGFVITDARSNDPRFELIEMLGLPAIVVGDPETVAPFPVHGPDESVGTGLAMRYLLDLGHERIDYVSGPEIWEHGRRRRVAWQDGLAAAGLPERYAVESDFTSPGGAEATERLLQQAVTPPTAIVYGNDLMAMAGMSVLRQHGLRIPEDVSVVGYDDIPLAGHLSPALTTVRQDVLGNGRLVASRLLASITGEAIAIDPVQPPELVVRDSTAAPA